jgi:hypothetical protein
MGASFESPMNFPQNIPEELKYLTLGLSQGCLVNMKVFYLAMLVPLALSWFSWQQNLQAQNLNAQTHQITSDEPASLAKSHTAAVSHLATGRRSGTRPNDPCPAL